MYQIEANKGGVGNVYYVINSDDSNYAYVVDHYEKTYLDGSSAVQATVQAALTACVGNRNDYVLVQPSADDYTLAATLTMSTRGVHLICPQAIRPNNSMPTIGAKLAQGGNYPVLTISAHDCEVAGFFLIGKADYSVIVLSGAIWHPHIHNNFIGISTGDSGNSNAAGIYGTSGVVHYCFEGNYITNYGPTGSGQTYGGGILLTSGGCTRGVVRNNIITTGGSNTFTAGINVNGYGAIVADNYLFEDVAWSGLTAGTFTNGIVTTTSSLVVNNRIGMVITANAISGGTVNSFINNYSSHDGGTITM